MKKSKSNESQFSNEPEALARIIELLQLVHSVNTSPLGVLSFDKKFEAQVHIKQLLTKFPGIAKIIVRDHLSLVTDCSVISSLIVADPGCADILLAQRKLREKLYIISDVIDILSVRADMQSTLFADEEMAFLHKRSEVDNLVKMITSVPSSANYLLARQDIQNSIYVLHQLTSILTIAPQWTATLLSQSRFQNMIMQSIDRAKASTSFSDYHLDNLLVLMRICQSAGVPNPFAYDISELLFYQMNSVDIDELKSDEYERVKYLSYVDAVGKTLFLSRCRKVAQVLFPDEVIPKKSVNKQYQLTLDPQALRSTLFNWCNSRVQYQAHCLLCKAHQTAASQDFEALAEYIRSHPAASAIFLRPESQSLINNFSLLIVIIASAPNVAAALLSNPEVRKQIDSIELLTRFVKDIPGHAVELSVHTDMQELVMHEVEKGQLLLSNNRPCEVYFTIWPKLKAFIVACRLSDFKIPVTLQKFADDFEDNMHRVLDLNNPTNPLIALIKKHPTPEKIHRLLQHEYINEGLLSIADLTEILQICPGYRTKLLSLPRTQHIITQSITQLDTLVLAGDIYRAVGFVLKDIVTFLNISLLSNKEIHSALLNCLQSSHDVLLKVPELRDTCKQAANLLGASHNAKECASLLEENSLSRLSERSEEPPDDFSFVI